MITNLEPRQPNRRIETFMDIAVTLADYTQSAARCADIPDYLGGIFDLEHITLAVVRQSADDAEPQVVLYGASQSPATVEDIGIMRQNVKVLLRQVVPETWHENPPTSFPAAHQVQPYAEIPTPYFYRCCRAHVFAFALDRNHHMLLIVHRRLRDFRVPLVVVDNLLVIANELAKQIHCLVAWQKSPRMLGKPFERLTEKEWVVLRGLTSEASEKQLASQLSIRANTLHTHIKSIYRKVGVQGRIPLLMRFNKALSQMRIDMLNAHGQSAMLLQQEPAPTVAEAHAVDQLPS